MNIQEQKTKSRNCYTSKCPVCNKEIKGFSAWHLKYNFGLHTESHSRDSKTEKGGAK